jgi:hypothetical protein
MSTNPLTNRLYTFRFRMLGSIGEQSYECGIAMRSKISPIFNSWHIIFSTAKSNSNRQLKKDLSWKM